MTFVERMPGEPLDSMLRRFVTGVENGGVLREFRDRRWHVSLGERRRLKARAAEKRRRRAERRRGGAAA